jgi:ATP-binding cassette subfamily B protein
MSIKSNAPPKNGRRLLAMLVPVWKPAAVVLLLTLLTSGIAAVGPLVQKAIFDALAGQAPPLEQWTPTGYLFAAIALLLSLALVAELVSFATSYLSWRIRLRTNFNLLDKVVSHLYSMPLSFHHREPVEVIRTRIDRGVNGFCNTLFDITFGILPSVMYLACTVVFMLALSWKLSLVALVFLPIPAIVGKYAGAIASAREKVLTDRWASIFSRFNETLALIKIVKSFTREESEKGKFLGEVKDTLGIVQRGIAVDSGLGAAKHFSMVLGSIAVLGYGAFLIQQGEITIGTLVAVLAYVNGMANPVLGLAGMYEAFCKAKVYFGIVSEVLDERREIEDAPDARVLTQVKGAVRFENVSFGYRKDKPIVRDMSFEVPAGSFVALVGPSGSGKTTIVDLLNRFFDPQSGSVSIDGVDVRDVTQLSLHRNIGMVLQDTPLFNDTIRNNIAFGKHDATEEEIVAAAKAAYAHDFIMRLPMGYETKVRGSQGLSGGERQRIAIARALLKSAPILVFDEASANLDSESEALVHQSMQALRGERTMLVIAHRLSTVKKADMILVVENGRIVESGTHVELIEAGGLYCKLVALQSLSTNDKAA